jgi:hypothetical protein
MNCRRTLRATLDRLGIPYVETRIAWKRTRYGSSPVFALVISDDDAPRLRADRASTAGARAVVNRSARLARVEAARLQAIHDYESLGVLPGSRTLAAFRAGEIDECEARRIGAITRHRHEETEYDALLARGIDRDTARAMIGGRP